MLENFTEEEIRSLATKFLSLSAVKAIGDWEIEIRAVPYGIDKDRQTFSAETEYMEKIFKTPAIIYHHGIKPGSATKEGVLGLKTGDSWESRPVVIGEAVSVEKRADGVYVRAILDKSVEYAKRVWDAAKKGMAVASSDSITHLSRMLSNGKEIMYEKTRPGKVSVWPLAGVSLWDNSAGNFPPASHNAIALPAMKAIYRDAGLDFPDFSSDTTGAAQADKRAQQRAEIVKKSQQILQNNKNRRTYHEATRTTTRYSG